MKAFNNMYNSEFVSTEHKQYNALALYKCKELSLLFGDSRYL